MMASNEEKFLNSNAVNDELFIEIAETALELSRDKFKLVLVLLTPAVSASENFISVVYRAKIKIEILKTKETQSVDTIVKVLLTNIKEIAEFAVFPRERLMYERILFDFEKMYREIAGEEIHFGPKSLLFKDNPYEMIVLEDLKVRNFHMYDRKVGMNQEQTKVVLSKLAYMHAASALQYQKTGITDKLFDREASLPPLTDDNHLVTGFAKMFDNFAAAVKKYGDCNKYADKISQWDANKIIKSWWIDVAKPMKSGFVTLNHGDLWLNNLMFKTNGNNLMVYFIDFQANYWGNPINDVIYFLISSVDDGIVTTHFVNFIKFYQETLTDALKKLKYEGHYPTLVEMHQEILASSSFVAACLFLILFVKNGSQEEFNLDKVIGSDDPKMLQGIYNDSNYKRALKIWLQYLNDHGILDAVVKKTK